MNRVTFAGAVVRLMCVDKNPKRWCSGVLCTGIALFRLHAVWILCGFDFYAVFLLASQWT